MLQVDHIQPFAYGGSSKAENLRLSLRRSQSGANGPRVLFLSEGGKEQC